MNEYKQGLKYECSHIACVSYLSSHRSNQSVRNTFTILVSFTKKKEEKKNTRIIKLSILPLYIVRILG